MTEKEEYNLKLPRSTLILMVGCSLFAAFFVFLWLYPNIRKARKQDLQIQSLSVRIEEQKILQPFFKNITDLIEKEKRSHPEQLKLPERGALDRQNADQWQAELKRTADAAALDVIEIRPDFKTLIGESGLLMVSMSVTGNFDRLRQFIINIIKLPYFDHLALVQIQSGPVSQALWLKLQVHLRQK